MPLNILVGKMHNKAMSNREPLLGLPRLIRCDRGTENAKVAFLQPFLCRNGPDTSAGIKRFQYGCSVTNQV